MLSAKKNKAVVDVKALSKEIDGLNERNQFLLTAVRTLLQTFRGTALEFEEIDADAFNGNLDTLVQLLTSDEKIKSMKTGFEKETKKVSAFILQQKAYQQEKESELKGIIDILTKAMASFDADNRFFNQKMIAQSQNLEKLTLLDDIRRIKSELELGVTSMRETVNEKQNQDNNKLERLSRQVSVLEDELHKAKMESATDGLTGIRNRAAFDRYIMNLVEDNMVKSAPFSLLIFDLDDFKSINDTYGHQTGDRVLLSVARKCKDFVREQDFLARYGGEEFVIVLPGASLRNATKRAKHLCRAIAATEYALDNSFEGITLSVTVSIGVCTFKKGDTTESLIGRADKALYQAKKTGKNRVVSEKKLSS